MRFQALPLPTGQFILAQASVTGEVTLQNGAPIVAQWRDDLPGNPGVYTWKARQYPAAIFDSYRSANLTAQALTREATA